AEKFGAGPRPLPRQNVARYIILYRGRVVSHWAICDSDLFVFEAPLLLAVVAYGAVLFSSSWLCPRSALRSFGLLVISFVLAFLSTWCYMIFALNTYGS